jgi:DNA-binding MarR family transcriptional regulator
VVVEPDVGVDTVVAVEHALTRFMRQATRPALGKWLSDVGGVSLDRADYVALARIDEAEPVRLTELAEILGIDLSAVSRQVRDLVESALVERSKDACDQRASLLRLTREGRALLVRVRMARQDAMRRMLAGWSESDQRALARLVARLARDIEAQVSLDSQASGRTPGPAQAPTVRLAGRPA